MTASPIGTPNRLDANPGDRNLLTDRSGAALDAVVLPSSASTWLLSQMVNVKPIRKLLVELQYDGHASTTTGYPLVRPLFCTQAGQPLYSDDVWFGPLITDGSIAATAQAGTAIGTAEAHGPLQGLQVHRELVLQPPAVVANNGKIRAGFLLDVGAARWVQFECAEQGDLVNRGKLRIYVCGIS